MEPRIDYLRNGRGAFEAMFGLEKYLAQSGLDPKLMTLIKLRLLKLTVAAVCDRRVVSFFPAARLPS
jgi:hypothetical protein